MIKPNEIVFSFPVSPVDKLISKICSSLGYYLIPQWRLRNLDFASYLIKLIKHYQIETIIDIGANRGQYATMLRNEVGYKQQIHSLEPVSTIFQELVKNSSADPLWHAHQLAISQKKEQKEINILEPDVLTSFLDPKRADEMPHQEFKEGIPLSRKETVNCLPLSDFIEKQEIDTKHCLIKTDTQGYDLEVISSLGSTISQIPLIQAEIPNLSYYQNSNSYQEFIEFLEQRNFQLANLSPVTYESNLIAFEYDAFFINKCLL